ncbi:MAG: phage minor head protein [Treponemataceae bacterium]
MKTLIKVLTSFTGNFTKQSFLQKQSFSEIWDEFKKIGSDAGIDISAGYFETVYRTNIQSAYNAGRLIRYKNNQPPAWELLFMEDGNMSEICTALMNEVGGKAIKSDDPFWSTVGFPPYHYNCRTTFRAVYDYELNEGEIDLAAPKESAPLDNGFGGNPLEKESWWRLTDTMKERAKEYGLKDDIEAMAKKLGLKNYDVRLANEVTKRQLGHTDFYAKTIKGANPKQHEIEIARILHKNGHEVLFTPENNFIQGIKNPDGILTNKNAIIEMKEVASKKLDKVSDNIEKAIGQNAEIIILNLVGEKDFAEKDAINKRKTI